MNDQDARKIIEAVLFSTSEVTQVKELVGILGNTNVPLVRQQIEVLNREYEQTSRTFRIQKIGEGYQMRTLPMYKTWIQKAEPLKPVKLSPPALETLAIVAYKQPVTRAEIEHLRGVDASNGLRGLLEKRLIRILGKDTGPGRPLLYGTSREFLSLFGMSDLRELPTIEDLDLTQGAPGPLKSAQPKTDPAAAEPAARMQDAG